MELGGRCTRGHPGLCPPSRYWYATGDSCRLTITSLPNRDSLRRGHADLIERTPPLQVCSNAVNAHALRNTINRCLCLSVCLSVQYSTSLLESYVPQCYQYREAQNIGCVVLARGASKILGHKNQTHARACDISPICLGAPTWAIAFVFGMHGNFADVITRAKFFVDLFRGFRVLRLPMFLFSI